MLWGCGPPASEPTQDAAVRPFSSAPEVQRIEGAAFIGVNVVDVTEGRILRDRTVYVESGIIRAVGPRGSVVVPNDALRIQARGGYLMPGLADMHVHHTGAGAFGQWTSPAYGEAELLLYVANGVTTVRNLAGTAVDLRMKRRLDEGRIPGPRYYSSGPPVVHRGVDHAVETEDQGRGAVRAQWEAGYDLVKVYCCFTPENAEVYHAILHEAEALGLPVVGHVQERLPGRDAFRLRTIEHLETLPRMFETGTASVAELVDAGTFVTPTIAMKEIHRLVDERLLETYLAGPEARYVGHVQYDPTVRDIRAGRSFLQDTVEARRAERLYDQAQRYALLLHEAGVPLLVGSEGGAIITSVPGFSTHRELELLVKAGLTPVAALRAGTLHAARALGADHRRGSVAEGMEADLVLLDADPLAAISNTREIRGVLFGDLWLDDAGLEQTLRRLRKR